MKKMMVTLAVVLMAALNADFAAAENLTDKLAGSIRFGFTLPSDSDWDVAGPISSDSGFTYGAGLLFGLSRDLAVEAEVTHSTYDLRYDRFSKDGTADITNLSFGLQWRFASRQLTPYVGGGLSVLFNDYTDSDVENTVGVNLKAGIDYFVSPRVALNGEMKMVISPSADMSYRPVYDHGSFDPSSFSGLFGIRYFF